MGFFVLFEAIHPLLSARVRDRDNDKQEERYEQTNDDQTAIIMKTKRKVTVVNWQANHGRVFEFDEEV